MSETHDPWKDVEAELARCREIAAEWGVSPDSVQLSLTPDSLVRLLAARAAEATQHQQEIAAKDAELDKLRVFLGDASPKSDALRRQFDAEIATLRATVDQQAETIHQLQATLPELHDAIERQSAQIATLTQERDALLNSANYWKANHLAGNVELEAAEARCATLTAALECVYNAFKEASLDESYPLADDLARAALAVAPQGGTPK